MEKSRYGYVVLAMATLAVFCALGLGRFGYSVVLPPMQRSLALDNTAAGLLASSNLAGYLALAALGGALSSRFGPRRVVAAGLVVAGFGMACTGLVHGLAGALLWRAVTGFGSGAANIGAVGMIPAWFPPHRRGTAAGVAVTGSSLALIVTGPLVPGILRWGGDEGWRAVWFVFAGVTLVSALAALLLVRLPAEVVPYSASAAPKPPEGLRWGDVYRSGRIWRLGLVYAAFGFSYIIYMTFFVKFLVAEGGYSRDRAGGLFMLIGWCSLGCGFFWGWVSDLIGRYRALAAIFFLQALAFGLFALKQEPLFTVSAVLFGITAWSIPAIMSAVSGDVSGPRLAPATLGFITLFMGVGQALGPGIAGRIADLSGSFAPSFFLAAAVALAGAVFSLALEGGRRAADSGG